MSFINAFLEQTIYLGMPDDSVCNSVVVFQLLRPTSVFFPFFLFLWYVRVERMIRQSTRERESKTDRQREREVLEDSKGKE